MRVWSPDVPRCSWKNCSPVMGSLQLSVLPDLALAHCLSFPGKLSLRVTRRQLLNPWYFHLWLEMITATFSIRFEGAGSSNTLHLNKVSVFGKPTCYVAFLLFLNFL